MKKIKLVILPVLSITALASCNKGIKEYEVISINNIKYLLYNGVDKVAFVVGHNYGLADEITLPSKVNGYPLKAISREAFEYSCLSKITIPDSISYIGSEAFSYCNNLKEITLPNTIDTLSSNTFKNCYSLTNITLPNNLSYIDDGAFLGCYSLTNITLPNSLFGLGSYVFGGCESLVNLDFSKTRLNDIGSYCFYDCNKLSNISLSDNIYVINDNSFSNCSSLKKIYIPKSIFYLGEDIFNKCNDNLKILFEDSKLPSFCSYNFSSGYPFALGTDKNAALSDIFVKDTNNNQYSINNYKTNNPTAFLHYVDTNVNEITIPATINYGTEGKSADVTEIMSTAFISNESLTNVNLESLSKLASIGANAFYYDTELITIKLPTSKTNASLGLGVFYKCRKLSTIENLGLINDLILNGYTFAECYNLGKDTPFSFTSNIKSITSTDFNEWGTAGTQTIKLETGSYKKDSQTGVVTLTAKGDNEETITLKDEGFSKYSNSKYFGKAIITLG